jgi:transposase
VARRANALVLLDEGMSREQVAQALLLDDDTIRRWHGAFAEGGRKALMRFEAGGSAGSLSEAQQEKLAAWVRAASPRSTRQVGAWIASELGVGYDSRSGLAALLHRLCFEYRKPEFTPRHLDENKQREFMSLHEKLMNSLSADETVVFVDAVHSTHAARAAGCWAAKDEKLAIEQTTGRQRLNIHGAIELETGHTKMIEAETVDAASTINLLEALEALYSTTALIHVFLDNATIPTRTKDRACISSHRTARISIRSRDCGRSCMSICRTTKPTPPVANSPTRFSISYATKSPRDGANFAVRSQTTSV